MPNKDVWKTEPEFFSWIRGGIRGGLWNRHPVKLKVLNKQRIKIDNPNPKGRVKQVWGAKCALCKQYHVIKDIQVDHIDGDYRNNKIDNLRLLCPNCHSLSSNYKNLNKGKGRSKRKRFEVK